MQRHVTGNRGCGCNIADEMRQEAAPSGAAEEQIPAEGPEAEGNALASQQQEQEMNADLVAVKVKSSLASFGSC